MDQIPVVTGRKSFLVRSPRILKLFVVSVIAVNLLLGSGVVLLRSVLLHQQLLVVVDAEIPASISVRMTDGETSASANFLGIIIIFAIGTFCLSAGLLNWKLFLRFYEGQQSMSNLGARWYSGLAGACLIGLSYWSAWQSMAPALQAEATFRATAKARSDFESKVRIWTISRGGEVEQFSGRFQNITGTGATVVLSDSGSLVSAPFSGFVEEDREYLRQILQGRDMQIPSALSEKGNGVWRLFAEPALSKAEGRAGTEFGSGESNKKIVPAQHGAPPIDPVNRKKPLINQPIQVGNGNRMFLSSNPPLAVTIGRYKRPRETRVYDLTTGSEIAEGKIEADELLAVSEDGSYAVGISHDDRPAVWKIGESLKLQGLLPEDIDFATFVGTEQLIISIGGKLQARLLPSLRVASSFNVTGSSPVRTPGGRYIAIYVPGAFQFYDIRTGWPTGILPVRHDWQVIGSPIIEPDGRRLAAMVTDLYGVLRIACWDLTSQKLLFSAPCPIIGRMYSTRFRNRGKLWRPVGREMTRGRVQPMQFLNRSYLLCGEFLVSIDRGKFVQRIARRNLPEGCSPDYRVWIYSTFGKDSVFGPVAIVDDPLHAKIQTARTPTPFLDPDEPVALDIQFLVNPPSGFRERLRALIKQKLAELQVRIDATSRHRVRVVVNDEPLGDVIHVAVFRETRYQSDSTSLVQQDMIPISDRRLSVTIEAMPPGVNSHWFEGVSCEGKSLPEIELSWLQSVTPELFLSKRWDVVEQKLARLDFRSALSSYDAF